MSGKRKFVVPNPGCGGVVPVRLITDRAKRYRANSPQCLPPGPRQCEFCGSKRNVVVNHRDGDESNGARANLGYACKSCNTRIGAAFAVAGAGRRTKQYNPGVPSAAQYAWAVTQICRKRDQAKGQCSPSNDEQTKKAVAIIRATPGSKRRQYASAARLARGRYRDEVPF